MLPQTNKHCAAVSIVARSSPEGKLKKKNRNKIKGDSMRKTFAILAVLLIAKIFLAECVPFLEEEIDNGKLYVAVTVRR